MPPSPIETALQLHRSGKLQEAEAIYRQILDRTPRDAGVLHLLGLVHYQRKQYQEAATLLQKAISINGREPLFHFNLGKVLQEAGKAADAAPCYQRAIRLQPNYAEALANLGSVCMELGRDDQALQYLERALALQPQWHSWRIPLSSLLCHMSRFKEAMHQLQLVLDNEPDNSAAHHLIAEIYLTHRDFGMAVQHYQRAAALGRETVNLYNQLAVALYNLGEYAQALAAYDHVIQLMPDAVEQGAGLGIGNIKLSQGLYDEAIAAYRSVVSNTNPEIALKAHSNLLLALHYLPPSDSLALFDTARLWNERYAIPLAQPHPTYANPPETDRRLRVGYVSADFKRHPVGYFLQSILPSHSEQIETFLYSSLEGEDDLTAWFKKLPSCHWRPIATASDDSVAGMVRDDGIDVLVDLSGHTGGHRLLVFARKAAPVQVTWLGYCDTTGLDAIDYLLADAVSIPPETRQPFSEQIWHLPGSYLCYQAPDTPPDIAPPPASHNGHITFGCMNNLSKVSAPMVAVWADILHRLPDARFILKTKQLKDESTRQRYLGFFSDHGIPADRLTLSGEFLQQSDQFAYYSNIDIALDTFPYNGVTTTCDAAWMGVSTITLAGENFISRNGASILTNLGLPELVATTPEQYVDIAVNLAKDLPRLSALRSTMRARFANSPLGDPQLFTHNLEQAYRDMWKKWCSSRHAANT